MKIDEEDQGSEGLELKEGVSWNIYHSLYESVARLVEERYKEKYRSIYGEACNLAEGFCAKEPFKKDIPQVLQCGTASSQTTQALLEFTREKNPNTQLHVLDQSMQPLRRCQENLVNKGITFIHSDIRDSGIPSGSIDVIETDRFLQFFSPEGQKEVFTEWGRLLSPEGMILTRDFLPSGKRGLMINAIRKKILRTMIPGVKIYPVEGSHVKKGFLEVGLECSIASTEMNSRLIKHIIAYKK